MDQADQIIAELQKIGLPEKEARVYLASLELGEATAQQIAVRAIVNRPTTYVMIESLAKRGLMSSVIRGKKRYFAAEPPEKIETYINTEVQQLLIRQKSANHLIKRINGKSKTDRPKVKLFEGRIGFNNLLDDVGTSHPENFVELVDIDAMAKAVSPLELREFRKQLGKNNKSGFVLYCGNTIIPKDDPSERKNFPKLKKIKLPKQYTNINSNIGVYGNRVVMVSFDEQLHSISIESDVFSKALSTLFDLAKKGAK